MRSDTKRNTDPLRRKARPPAIPPITPDYMNGSKGDSKDQVTISSADAELFAQLLKEKERWARIEEEVREENRNLQARITKERKRHGHVEQLFTDQQNKFAKQLAALQTLVIGNLKLVKPALPEAQ